MENGNRFHKKNFLLQQLVFQFMQKCRVEKMIVHIILQQHIIRLHTRFQLDSINIVAVLCMKNMDIIHQHF